MPKIPMLFRFSLYGFLKNQQYYDPFIILAFREKGLSFFMIGILIAFRSACTNLFEIPSGAVADLHGRRLSMVLSFCAYIVSFLIFGFSTAVWTLFAAMFFFAIGEAFRTGTHKAMIFTWLRNNNRLDKRTRTYGYTRSWSKIGSAVSVIIATGLVFYTGNYSVIFLYCIIPYAINIINFLGYPKDVDITSDKKVSARDLFTHLWQSFRQVVHLPPLRRALVETMSFEGTFKTVKDYLQPVLKQAAVALPLFVWMADDKKRAAILIGLFYFVLYLLSSAASRRAHWVVDKAKNEDRASCWLWWGNIITFIAITPLLAYGYYLLAGIGFILLSVLQNFWRPVIITRFDHHSDLAMGATIMSIESQSRTFATMLLAPLLGYVVDLYGFWTIGVLGVAVSLGILVSSGKK